MLAIFFLSLEVVAAKTSPKLEKVAPVNKNFVPTRASSMQFWIIIGMMLLAYTVGIGVAIYVGYIQKDSLSKKDTQTAS